MTAAAPINYAGCRLECLYRADADGIVLLAVLAGGEDISPIAAPGSAVWREIEYALIEHIISHMEPHA